MPRPVRLPLGSALYAWLILHALAIPAWAQDASLGPPEAAAEASADGVSPPIGIWQRDHLRQLLLETFQPPERDALRKTAPEYVVGRQIDFKGVWRNGLNWETADRAFRMHLGGLMHMESGWWQAGSALMNAPGGVGPLEDGARFRRLRMHTLGTMYEVVDWTMEVGFENGQPQFYNVYAELPNLPWIGTLRMGHFREPFGIDALTSYNNLTFTERDMLLDPFVPFFNMGIMLYGPLFDERLNYWTGIFASGSDNFTAIDFGDGRHAWTSRLALSPWYDQENGNALHLAIAYSRRALPLLDAAGKADAKGKPRVVFASRPETRVNAPYFISTGVIEADTENLLGTEFALGLGPWLVQAEYMRAVVENALLPGGGTTRGTLSYDGFSAQVSWFMTGENRPYVRREGIFGAVRPFENYFLVRGGPDDGKPWLWGRGAWELALRYSQVNLDNGVINGGNLRAVTFGLNWYLNPNCRFLWDYLLTWRDVPIGVSDGLAQTLGARFQLEF